MINMRRTGMVRYLAKVSPMPTMGVLLKSQELADVMAYLMMLK